MAQANIREVARHAGVSVGTVSNVLNRPDIVGAATRERVLDAIRELGFVRNEAARHLRAGRSRTVGLVVLDVANPYFTDVARGVEELADTQHTMVVLCNSDGQVGRELRHVAQLEEQRVLGVLITPAETDNPYLAEVAERGTPVVLVDREAGREHCSVAVNDVMGGHLAGAHLLEEGHEHIAFVGGPSSFKQVADRKAGLQAAISGANANGARVAELTMASLSVAAGRDAGEKIAQLLPNERPTAAFCGNDLLALGFLQEMTRQGIRVPDDMAIVGYDDIEFAAAAAVPLSSVRQPREQLGRAAMELLLDEVENGETHTHRQVVFQPKLVVRESSRRSL